MHRTYRLSDLFNKIHACNTWKRFVRSHATFDEIIVSMQRRGTLRAGDDECLATGCPRIHLRRDARDYLARLIQANSWGMGRKKRLSFVKTRYKNIHFYENRRLTKTEINLFKEQWKMYADSHGLFVETEEQPTGSKAAATT